MIREGDGIAGRVLMSLGLTLELAREEAAKLVGRGDSAPPGHLIFTPRAKKVLELSLREALQLGHNFVGTEHILLGLIREGEGSNGTGATMLKGILGIDLLTIRKAVLEHLFGPPPPPPSVAQAEPAPLLRTKGRFCRGDATVEWGPDEDGPDMIIGRAPVEAADDLIVLVTGARDEIVGLGEAVRLLEKFGFTVTPPAVLDDDAPTNVGKMELVDPES